MTESVARRVIWLTDSEWARLKARAAREGVNVSNLVRTLAGEQPVALDRFGVPSAAPKRRAAR